MGLNICCKRLQKDLIAFPNIFTNGKLKSTFPKFWNKLILVQKNSSKQKGVPIILNKNVSRSNKSLKYLHYYLHPKLSLKKEATCHEV